MLSLRLLSEAAALVAAAEPALSIHACLRPSRSTASAQLLTTGLSGLPQPRVPPSRTRWISSSAPPLRGDKPSPSSSLGPLPPLPPPPASRSPADKPRPKKPANNNNAKTSPPPPPPSRSPTPPPPPRSPTPSSSSSPSSASSSAKKSSSPPPPSAPPTSQLFPSLSTPQEPSSSPDAAASSTWNQIKPASAPQKIAVSRETRIQSLMDEVKKLSNNETPKDVPAAQLERLDKECQQLLSFFRARNIATYLFRRTKITGPPPPIDLLISLEKRGMQIASDFEPQSIVMVLQGLSRLSNFATSEEYLRALERQSTNCIQEFSSQDIALCLDALSRFYASQYHMPAAEYFPLIEQHSIGQIQHFNPKDVAHSMGAIARFGKAFRPSSNYLSAIERQSLAVMRSFTGQDIVQSLAAVRLFNSGTFSSAYFAQIERQLLDHIGQLGPDDLRVVATAFDRLHHRVADTTARALKQQFLSVGLQHASVQVIFDLLRIFHAWGAPLSPEQLALVNERIRVIESDIAKRTELQIAELTGADEQEINEIVAELEQFERTDDIADDAIPGP